MVWAGVEPHEPLAALHRKVDQLLARVGVAPETRAFMPHITLARLNRGSGPVAPFLALNSDLASPPFEFSHVTLYESEMGHGGSRYHPVARYSLGENSATSAAATAATSSHVARSEEHQSELQSRMRTSTADICLKQTKLIYY